jgi:hypothetical protein
MIEPIDQIEMVRESQLRPFDPQRAARTRAGSIEAFDRLLRESQENPESFWAQVASELDWMKPWESVRKACPRRQAAKSCAVSWSSFPRRDVFKVM